MPSPLNYLVLLNTLYRLCFVLSSWKIGLFVSIVHWHFFSFRNFVEKLCVSWAFPLIECVAVWALKTPVPHTDVLKTHSSQSFSTELLEYKGTGSEHLSQTNPSKLSFSLSYNRIPKYLSGCGCCCIFPSHHSPLSL